MNPDRALARSTPLGILLGFVVLREVCVGRRWTWTAMRVEAARCTLTVRARMLPRRALCVTGPDMAYIGGQRRMTAPSTCVPAGFQVEAPRMSRCSALLRAESETDIKFVAASTTDIGRCERGDDCVTLHRVGCLCLRACYAMLGADTAPQDGALRCGGS